MNVCTRLSINQSIHPSINLSIVPPIQSSPPILTTLFDLPHVEHARVGAGAGERVVGQDEPADTHMCMSGRITL